MNIKQDYSYGIVPVRKNPAGELEFLVIYQYSWIGDHHYWIFPKGHAEGEEDPQQAALRELTEETGLSATIRDEQVFFIRYEFRNQEDLIQKEVHFFIGWIEGEQPLTFQPEEVSDAIWLPYQAAHERLSNENAKQLLQKVAIHLEIS